MSVESDSFRVASRVVVTRVRSAIGATPKARGTLRALGLRKTGKARVHADTATLRGMVARVPHLVTVQALQSDEAAADAPVRPRAKDHHMRRDMYTEERYLAGGKPARMVRLPTGEHFTAELSQARLSVNWTVDVGAEKFAVIADEVLGLGHRKGDGYVVATGDDSSPPSDPMPIRKALGLIEKLGEAELIRFDLEGSASGGVMSLCWSPFPDADGNVRPHVGLIGDALDSRLLRELLEATASPGLRGAEDVCVSDAITVQSGVESGRNVE